MYLHTRSGPLRCQGVRQYRQGLGSPGVKRCCHAVFWGKSKSNQCSIGDHDNGDQGEIRKANRLDSEIQTHV